MIGVSFMDCRLPRWVVGNRFDHTFGTLFCVNFVLVRTFFGVRFVFGKGDVGIAHWCPPVDQLLARRNYRSDAVLQYEQSVIRGRAMATKSKLRQEQEAGMDVYPVRMTAAHARKARHLGEGNLSEGVRAAVEKATPEPLVERRKGPLDRRRPKG